MDHISAGYREHEHTADWELEVWAPDIGMLLEQAARGMYALSGIQLEYAPRLERTVRIEAVDLEMLLVRFLQELLYLDEMEGLGFDRFDIQLEPGRLTARLWGAVLRSKTREIKAVTYHKLKIDSSPGGLRVWIVFDV
jgi:SHS2 domain-containing protein